MILVFSPKITPRLDYTVGLIFRDILGTSAEITSDPDAFKRSEAPKINYSDAPLPGGLYLRADPLLSETGIKHYDPSPIVFEGETGFFGTSADSFLPFDPFASAFLLVSRMEEYLPGERDRFGRFPAKASLLYRNGLIEKPVVNRWALLVARELEKHYGKMIFPARKFRFSPTIDIDNAWAYRHKGLLRTVAGMGKEVLKGDFGNFRERMLVLSRKRKDPYDTYDYLEQVFRGNESRIVLFFLIGDYAKYDKQVSWKNRNFRKLIKELGQKFEVGIHPSMSASTTGNYSLVKTEKDRLEQIIGKKVNRSHQHYLMLKMPDTYLHLTEAGITEDYSMGYPDLPGFRAGICTPFYFYDLTCEKVTPLKIFPFQVMEATFLQYLNLHPSGALEKIKTIMEEVKKTGGVFSAIWHNESLGNNGKMDRWKNVFEEMIVTGFRYADQL